MKVLSNWSGFPEALRGGVLCIGNFDGVHLGHAKMLATGRQEASRRGVPFTIMTFDPHPSVILKPDLDRLPLTTAAQRQELLAKFEPDVLLVVPTDREFLGISPEDFLRDVVQGTPGRGIGATCLVEGPSFTFGRSAAGTIGTLQQVGASYGFETIAVPTQEQTLADFTLVNVSSSLIRWLISHGRVGDAQRALGRPYTLRGMVVKGAQRGRKIGFPTANIQSMQLLPAAGIYAGQATVDGRTYRAAISVGTNPTFDGKTTTVEAYLLDFPANPTAKPDSPGTPVLSDDIYGRTLDLAVMSWVRDMYSFSGVEPLVTQMNRDVQLTRQFIPTPQLQDHSSQ